MKFLRYPGGKGRLLSFLVRHLPTKEEIAGNYVEPFVGGGSVFLYIKPTNALISDLNAELINLYRGIKLYPHKVWETFKSFPAGKKSYYLVRDTRSDKKSLYFKAARTLYLNRTCFKGMWRHNPQGNFNVGYGGEERRWVVTHESIIELSKIFRKAEITNKDFEIVIKSASKNDFIFLDPPYKPGGKDLNEIHYSHRRFLFSEQIRLSKALKSLPKSKNIRWAMTNSSHEEILKLYDGFNIKKIPLGTGDRPGILTKNSNEVLITNY
jgi:DNA adenine methylase